MGPVGMGAMAWRNIWRNRRRTIITLASIVFGSFLAVIMTGIGDDTYGRMIDTAARMGNGHVTVQHPEHRMTPSPKRYVRDADGIAARLRADSAVVAANARIVGQVMIAAAGESRGASYIAIDPQAESAQTLLPLKGLAEGKLFAADDPNGIVLGHKLAQNLGVKLGRKVVFTMTDRHGEIHTALARVRGLVKTGTPGIDTGLALLPIAVARKALGYGEKDATLVALTVADQRDSIDVAERIKSQVPAEVDVLSWHSTMASLASFIDMKLSGTAFIEWLLMILVAAGIFNSMLVSVMERRREFGILAALGWSRVQLFALVMTESAWLAAVGLVSAVAVTAGPYYVLSTKGIDMSAVYGGKTPTVANIAVETTMYVRMHPENAVFLVVAILLATLLSGVLPAWQAGRVNPVDAIKLV